VFRALIVSLLILAAGGTFAAENTAEKSQTVLITGANRGIGLEMARQLDAKSYTVIATARKPDRASELNALEVRVEQLDVADAASVAALAAKLEGVGIDILVNNAGVGGQDVRRLKKVDFEKMADTFQVNAFGPMRVTQALLPNLEAGEGKTVVQISSVMGSIEKNMGGPYGYRASKTALNQLNKSLSAELGREGYTCVALHPGWVKTNMGGQRAPVEVVDSVTGLITVIEGLKPADNGRFLDFQGNELPW
jgi:NAD(P)-dependent dehydrogenase (short-subunit alcohol dehydrogenase family)